MSTQHEIIQARLRERGRSAYWLAHATGRSRQHINRVVRGDAIITGADLINRVATALDLDPDILYTSAGRIPPDIVDAIVTNPQLIKAIRAKSKRMEALK